MTNQEEHDLAIAILRKGLTKALTRAVLAAGDNVLAVEGAKDGQMVSHAVSHVGNITTLDFAELIDKILSCLREQLYRTRLSNPILLYRTVQVRTQYSDKDTCMSTTITFETLVVTGSYPVLSR